MHFKFWNVLAVLIHFYSSTFTKAGPLAVDFEGTSGALDQKQNIYVVAKDLLTGDPSVISFDSEGALRLDFADRGVFSLQVPERSTLEKLAIENLSIDRKGNVWVIYSTMVKEQRPPSTPMARLFEVALNEHATKTRKIHTVVLDSHGESSRGFFDLNWQKLLFSFDVGNLNIPELHFVPEGFYLMAIDVDADGGPLAQIRKFNNRGKSDLTFGDRGRTILHNSDFVELGRYFMGSGNDEDRYIPRQLFGGPDAELSVSFELLKYSDVAPNETGHSQVWTGFVDLEKGQAVNMSERLVSLNVAKGKMPKRSSHFVLSGERKMLAATMAPTQHDIELFDLPALVRSQNSTPLSIKLHSPFAWSLDQGVVHVLSKEPKDRALEYENVGRLLPVNSFSLYSMSPETPSLINHRTIYCNRILDQIQLAKSN